MFNESALDRIANSFERIADVCETIGSIALDIKDRQEKGHGIILQCDVSSYQHPDSGRIYPLYVENSFEHGRELEVKVSDDEDLLRELTELIRQIMEGSCTFEHHLCDDQQDHHKKMW